MVIAETHAAGAHAPATHCCRTSGRPVVGVDEVGLGSLIGCVTSAAVILDEEIEGLCDSKKLNAADRERLAAIIMATCRHSIAHASLEEIDELGIHNATMLAMRRAVAGIQMPDNALVIVDGIKHPENMPCDIIAVPKADVTCPSVSAASIIAKVERDRIISELVIDPDVYGWRANKGYGTKAHLTAIRQFGPSPHHRRDFAPVKQMLRSATR